MLHYLLTACLMSSSILSNLLLVSANFFKCFNHFPEKVQVKSIQQSLQDFLEPINNNNSKILCKKGPLLEWRKLANFPVIGKIYDETCTF